MECDDSVRIQLSQEELSLLLGGIDLTQTKARNWYRKTLLAYKKTIRGVPEQFLEILPKIRPYSGNSPFRRRPLAGRPGRLVFQAATLTEYPNAFSAEALRFQEGQQVDVNGIGLGCGHAVRKALVGFQCAILQQLCRQRSSSGIRHDLVITIRFPKIV